MESFTLEEAESLVQFHCGSVDDFSFKADLNE